MVTDKIIQPYHPFNYGSYVCWHRTDGSILYGSICGFREIDNNQAVTFTGYDNGTKLAIVETSSGESIEVPLQQLELIED